MKNHNPLYWLPVSILFFLSAVSGCNLFKSASEEEYIAPSVPDNIAPPLAEQPEAKPAKKTAGLYKLVDPQTMEQVLQYKPPAGWMTGGKSEWIPQNPTAPHFFYVYAVSPDTAMKFATSSNIQLGGQGRIDQDPLLQPNTLAEKLFVPAAQKDYNLNNVQIVEALYEQAPDAAQRKQNHIQQAAAMGIRFTDVRCLNYKLKVKGTRDGKEYYVFYMAPMDILENQPGMSLKPCGVVWPAISPFRISVSFTAHASARVPPAP